MLSKTKIKLRIQHKNNSELEQTARAALKHERWKKVAQFVSGSTRKYSSVNLLDIDSLTKAGDTVVIVGKVLGEGDLTKKVRICALSFSATAREKMKKTKSEAVSVLDEITKNPKGEGIKIIP